MPKTLPSIEFLLERFVFSEDGKIFVKTRLRGDHRREGVEVGWTSEKGYRKVKIDHAVYYVHRLIFLVFNGWCPEILDHIDQNKLNNNPQNLRPASISLNARNRHKQRTARGKTVTSSYKGVSWHKGKKKWSATYCLSGKKRLHLGDFSTPEEAAEVYRQASLKYQEKT